MVDPNRTVMAPKIKGKQGEQFGIAHLTAKCGCGQTIHADGPGRIACRFCHAVSEITAPADFARTELKPPVKA